MTSLNKLRYKSYYYDEETGFYYLNSRYYDPYTGRFINLDKTEIIMEDDCYNLFLYCENDPINYSDRNGELRAMIFTNPEFVYDTTPIISASLPYMISGINVYTMSINDWTAFQTYWNSLGTNFDLLIFDGHGTPFELFYRQTYVSNGVESIVEKSVCTYLRTGYLNNITLDAIILIACNAGHADYSTNNIAKGLAEKSSAHVIASDGAVAVSKVTLNNSTKQLSMNSIVNAEFLSNCQAAGNSRTSNKGWLVYLSDRSYYYLNSTGGAGNTLTKTATMKYMIDRLVSAGVLA